MTAKSFFEQCVDTVHEHISDQVGKACFAVGMSEHGKPHQVVWIPRGGSIGGNLTPQRTVASTQATDRERIIPLCSKQLRVDARLTAPTFAQLETLHEDVLNAVHKAFPGTSSVAGAFEIRSESDDGAGNALGGIAMLVQAFVWDLVVVKETQRLVIVSAQEHECDLVSADTSLD